MKVLSLTAVGTTLFFLVAANISAQPPKSIPKTTVFVIIGVGLDLKCASDGCVSPNAYWTGTGKSYVSHWPKGWSPNWKNAKQYPMGGDLEPNFDVPNGAHCCQSESPTPINSKTGRVDWTGWK